MSYARERISFCGHCGWRSGRIVSGLSRADVDSNADPEGDRVECGACGQIGGVRHIWHQIVTEVPVEGSVGKKLQDEAAAG